MSDGGGGAALHTRACDLFGTRLPIVQTGMGWVSGATLTAATSSAGGLGILASATMTLGELDAAITRVRDRTDSPFGVNVVPAQADAEDRLAMVVERRVPVASFAAAPRPEQVQRLRDAGVVTIVTVGAPRHAEKVATMGVHAVIAQGAEGGGHTGVVPTALLVPAVASAVRGSGMVVLAAGGIHDGAGLAAALAWGADGVAMGTRFLLTAESRVAAAAKAAYLGAGLTSTVVTTAIDGAPQRVILTEAVERLEGVGRLRRLLGGVRNGLGFARSGGLSARDLLVSARRMHRDQGLPWSQVVMAANAPMMTKASVVDGDLDVGILPTGQVVGLIDDLPTVAELLERIAEGAVAALEHAAAGTAGDAGDGHDDSPGGT